MTECCDWGTLVDKAAQLEQKEFNIAQLNKSLCQINLDTGWSHQSEDRRY